jgi:hypothetical protein
MNWPGPLSYRQLLTWAEWMRQYHKQPKDPSRLTVKERTEMGKAKWFAALGLGADGKPLAQQQRPARPPNTAEDPRFGPVGKKNA